MTGSTDTTRSGMLFSQLLKPPLLHPGKRSRHSFLDPAAAPADVYLPNWKRGQPTAIDVTVISTLQQLTLAGAANTPGHALTVAEERKMAANSESCHALGINFIPLAVESLGGWSSEAIDTISSIGKLQGQCLGISPSETTRHLFQRLAIALWKGNATLWIRRQPSYPPLQCGRDYLTLSSYICVVLLCYIIKNSLP